MTVNVYKLVLSLFICQLAGIIGSVFTAPSIPTWYASLQKPLFAPPNWLFAPVWISLYLLMGLSLYIILSKDLRSRTVKIGLMLFAVQLALNSLWSVLFFGLQNPFYGLVGIIALWVFIFLTIYHFWKIDKKASYLLLPYLSWVSIASMLNYYIWVLNV